ncbi:MAG: metallophosphoesterase [Cytophagaceae bacterium]|nr:metallophosphoesterase [Cytophagaceae bacterium]
MIFLILFILLLATVLYYIFTSKKRKSPFYHKKEKKWKQSSPTDMEYVKYTVFLIGDAGAPSLNHPDKNLDLLRLKILKAGSKSAVFFLGDNIYPVGMPRPDDPGHERAEKRLLRQLKTLDAYTGKKVFISGNHDWNKGRKGGYEAVKRQQFYVESYFGSQEVFLPRNGCPGPVELPINDDLTIVVINTQWWVHSGTRPLGKINGCEVDSEHEFFQKLEEALEKNKGKKILVIGHHPMYSMAYHGGNFSMKQHLFPLTEVHKKLYIPLPVAGSIYPIYRKYIGSKEDMSHPRYKSMRKRLLNIFKKYDNLIYAAGHDHNLQYIQKAMQHYIVSGAGCKVTHVQKKKDAQFVHAHKGFMKLDFYYSDDVWLEVWEPDGTPYGRLAFRKQIISAVR